MGVIISIVLHIITIKRHLCECFYFHLQATVIDLKPGGADLEVTEANKKEYVA